MSRSKRRIALRPIPHIRLLPVSSLTVVGFPMEPTLHTDANITLAQWLHLWMDQVVTPNRAPTTIYGYQNIVEKHIIPALGGVRLRALQPSLISSYYRWLAAEKGLSHNTIHKHHVLLHTSLQYAFRQGLLPANPIERVTPPSQTLGAPQYYTPGQLSRLLSAVEGHPLELPVKLACYLGLRRSEILGLRWRDVDLQTGILSIRRARTTIGHKVVEKQPKTSGSFRALSIQSLDELLLLLRKLRVRREEAGIPCGPEDFLVLNTLGHPYHPNVLSAAFSDFIEDRGLPPITLHGLRHTFASMASNARVPLYQISQALGHSSPTTTQRIYTHLFDPTHGEVLAAVAAAIPAGGTRAPAKRRKTRK